ncbi:sulfotransferase domain-containing protein [Acaryochloris sp. CCMEE 5410]|uniref:sulfotransferase domain-containing protein n=1 Tax=Acaryochloris sp. CCMEE 5410 TaxID=310037 RepID=UPI0002483B92|nr:sulfotransferase domain-containing protein [Acaryochloris sp. CCMEE 5410]KAI9132421.1 sulfotransferase domain-containing protein [Acaryochloris sp. CCMEE 5410]
MYRIKKRLNIEHVTFDLYLIYALKFLYQKLFHLTCPQQQILMIVGCQRSGTSLINRIFARDFNINVYRESSCLSSNDPTQTGHFKLRLNSFQDLESDLLKDKSPTIVLKPLVETQNILHLLDHFPQSKALWMYRGYKDVVNSFLNKFSLNVGIRNIKAIIDGNTDFWYSESIPSSVRSTLVEFYRDDIQPADAVVLFWYVRNSFFFELELNLNSRVMMCKYEHMVCYPNQFINDIYSFLGKRFRAINTWEINSYSVDKGRSLDLSADIQELCDGLLSRLDQAFDKQMTAGQARPALRVANQRV